MIQACPKKLCHLRGSPQFQGPTGVQNLIVELITRRSANHKSVPRLTTRIVHHATIAIQNIPCAVESVQPEDESLPAFRKHSGQMKRVLSELSAEELRSLEVALKKLGKRAAALIEES